MRRLLLFSVLGIGLLAVNLWLPRQTQPIPQEVLEHMALAEREAQRGNDAQALGLYELLWSEGHHSAALHYNAALLYERQGEWVRALAHALEAQKGYPRDGDVGALIADLSAELGQGPTNIYPEWAAKVAYFLGRYVSLNELAVVAWCFALLSLLLWQARSSRLFIVVCLSASLVVGGLTALRLDFEREERAMVLEPLSHEGQTLGAATSLRILSQGQRELELFHPTSENNLWLSRHQVYQARGER